MNTKQVKTVSWALKCSFCVLAGLGFNSANALTITATSNATPTGEYIDFGTRFATAPSGTVETGIFEQDGGFDTRMSGSDVGTVLGASSLKSWVGLTGSTSATNNHAATSTFSWQDTITNGGASNSNYFYNLNIDQGALAAALDPFAGSVGNTSIYANYSLDVLVNGVSVWNSGAQIGRSATGTSQSQTGASLGGSFGTYVPSGTLYEGGLEADIIGLSSFGYQWDAFSTSIGLGTFSPGESFTLTYNAILETGGFSSNGDGYIAVSILGDPDLIGSIPGNSVTSVSAVPLPASLWLMISGLAGLFGFLRRKA